MRAKWDDFMEAYQDALRATSKPWAPWYSIPADDKPNMRLTISQILCATLEQMNPMQPEISQEDKQGLADCRRILLAEDPRTEKQREG